MSAVMKSLKRAMAGEYSRELSTKVFAGQCRLITLGYRQGGTPGYGLRRQLLDQHGQPKVILAPGERKSFQLERVILLALRVKKRIDEWTQASGTKSGRLFRSITPRAGNILSPQATYFQVTVRGGSPRGRLSTTSTFAPWPADSNSNL
jgi:hypothetical protein